MAFQKANISRQQYEIYEALEEEMDRNSSHESVAPIYFPQELARTETLQKDLEHFYGQDWREMIVVPTATLRYAQRLREIGSENPEYLVAHAYTRYLGDLSGGQVLGRVTQKSLGLKNGEGLAFFSFPGVSSPNLFKQLYRSRMNSIELTEKQREGLLEEAVRAFELNIQVFEELQNLAKILEKNELRQRHKTHNLQTPDVKGNQSSAFSSSSTTSSSLTSTSQLLRMLLGVGLALALGIGIDLSEKIKTVTKEVHVRANGTELMQAFQRGNITLMQYKIYEALEEELDRNSSHESVAPIYFPQELARTETLQKDLEHFYGQDWREMMVVPAATLRYAQRLREIGSENPEYLVAHAYTRYLGDLSGGQVLSRVPQRSLGLKNGEGLAFFCFPAISSPNLFKQLYRSRMNSIELTEKQREGVLEEAVRAFKFNIQVFEELQNLVKILEKNELRQRHKTHNLQTPDVKGNQSSAFTSSSPTSSSLTSTSLLLRMLLGVGFALALGMGLYVF
ncbi:Heme oxygenase [Bagarius yarrelli]|uniref:heme oxygenase (biliverdin-producing) n=1 Tax=Bagarius yarrelli TaxID=175774 RepID=A0A556TTF7_BAGYA|nr:Heme oxygenase [Bagarius yarrelli]